jgi:hypothetical protein
MSTARTVSWLVVLVTAYLPLKWLYEYFPVAPNAHFTDVLVPSAVCLSISGALAFFLVKSAKGLEILRAKEEEALNKFAQQPLTPVRPTKALLQKGETAFATINAALKEIQTVGYSGGSRGMSVRVAKGVTLRSGGYRSHAVKGMVKVATGELVATNQRVIFAGDNKSFSIALNKLINVTPYTDGVGLHDEHKNYLLGCGDGFACKSFIVTLHKVLNESRNEG